MSYFALFYDVVEDFLSRRSAYREEHLRLAREAHQCGALVLGGALTDPADRALLVFRAASRSVAEEFARHDPYVVHGLVTRWEVRPWAVVIGADQIWCEPTWRIAAIASITTDICRPAAGGRCSIWRATRGASWATNCIPVQTSTMVRRPTRSSGPSGSCRWTRRGASMRKASAN